MKMIFSEGALLKICLKICSKRENHTKVLNYTKTEEMFLYSIETKQDSERTLLTRIIKVEDKERITAIPTVPLNPHGYTVERLIDASKNLLGFLLKFPASDLAQGIVNLKKLKTDMDPFVSSIQISSAERHLKDISMVKFLPKNNGVYYTLRDYYQGVPQLYTVSAKCEIAKKRCTVMEEVHNAF